MSGAAYAQRSETFEAAGLRNWSGSRGYDAAGRFDRCAMTAKPGPTTSLSLLMNRDRDLSVAVTNSRWTLTPGTKETVRYAIDRGAPEKTEGTMTDLGLVIVIPRVPALQAGLQDGRSISVTVGKNTASLPLAGSRKAVAALTACVDAALAAEAKAPAPVPVATPVPTPEPAAPAAAMPAPVATPAEPPAPPPPPVAAPAEPVAPAPAA
ncbi:hypothetical protein HL658_05080, partial [Azospirillum sp. RWY-5-1]